jgi:putative ABC transport system permease protein
MPKITRDAHFAVKLLFKQTAFTAAALVTLALCIGANTAVFSVLNSVLLKPLPFAGAERMVRIYNSYPGAGVERGGASAPDYFDRREHVPALEGVAMITLQGVTIGESGRPERTTAQVVTPSFFDLLGVPAALGRTFLPAEGEPGGERHVVLSWGLWQERLGGDPAALGGSIRIDDVSHTVVGVMPRGFVFENRETRLWLPLAFTEAQRGDLARHANSWEMVGKLQPGATLGEAQQQIDALNARIGEQLPQFSELLAQVGFRSVVADYRSELTREVRGTLWLLQAGVLLVLLIGCINIANLLLVRATTRQRELATRAALGASRGRLATQMLTESLVLALLGGAVGLLAGWGAVQAFNAFATTDLPHSAEIAVDGTTMLVTLGVSALAGLLFGLMPLARLRVADLGAAFRDDGRSGTAGRETQRWRGGLVVAQVSLAFAVLVGAGLMLASFARTLAIDPGFEPANVLTASVSLPVTRYPDAEARRSFTDRLLERVRALPGVETAAVTNLLPFGGEINASAAAAEGYEPRPDDPLVAPVRSLVSDGYFETLGIEVLAGRTFNVQDVEGALPVAIVDPYLAQRFWPGQDAVGKRLTPGVPSVGGEAQYHTVVGVVEEVRMLSLTGDQPLGHYYVPAAQVPPTQLFLALRTALPPEVVSRALRTTVLELDADLPLYNVQPLEARLAASLATERLRMMLLVAFGVLALFLAAVGLYGVLAYAVAQRKTEIGIRMALGSSAAAVFALVLRQGALLVALGLGLGLAGSLALSRLVQSMLYGVQPAEPVVLATVLGVLATTALAACALPARRATRVDPMVAMREGN